MILGVIGYLLYPFLMGIANCKLLVYAIIITVVVSVSKYPKPNKNILTNNNPAYTNNGS